MTKIRRFEQINEDVYQESFETERVELLEKVTELMKQFQSFTSKVDKKQVYTCEEHYSNLDSLKEDLKLFKEK